MLIAAADSIGEAAQQIAAELDQIEDRVLSDALSDESAALLRLRRGISRQERLVQAAHSVLAQLEQTRGEKVLQAYRDLGSRVRQRIHAFRADLHLQADRARLLQEEVAAQLATATNRNLFALTVVTTLLRPRGVRSRAAAVSLGQRQVEPTPRRFEAGMPQPLGTRRRSAQSAAQTIPPFVPF
jgi:Mg2+ and Co2+ transporter CorA